MASIIDHEELAISRLATQFKESANLIEYIKVLLIEANPLEEALQQLLTDRWVDSAEGVQLDILGEIVGQPRLLVNSILLSYFGFDPDPGASSFGDVNDPSVGGRFRDGDELTTGNRLLIDSEYRLYIKTRIIKNSIVPTLPQYLEFFKLLFEVEEVIIIDGRMNYIVQISRALTPNEKVFLLNTDLLPKVAAVGAGFQEYDADSHFGFEGVPNSKGFGSVSDPLVGGKFSSIVS